MVAISGLVGAGHGRRARSIGPVRRSGIEVGLARQATHGADQHATKRVDDHVRSASASLLRLPRFPAPRRAVVPPARGPAHSPSGQRVQGLAAWAAHFKNGARSAANSRASRRLRCGPAHLRGRRRLSIHGLLTEQSHAARQRFKAWQLWLQVLLDRSKQDRVIDAEIAVDDAIPHSGHRRPWNVRICRLQRLAQVPDRLAREFS